MGQMITLEASDGFRPGAYLAEPGGTPKGAIVVLQEIFGVNAHIRELCDRLAADGWRAIAPALFDRQQPGFESGYSPEDVQAARAFIAKPDFDAFLADTDAARAHVADTGKVAAMGFCLGGAVAFAAATRLDGFAASICYYGGRIGQMADETPRCPVMMHFGRTDASIPMETVETIREKRPDAEIFVYEAGHGFNCDHRDAYDPEAAALAWSRSMEFLARTMG